MSLATNTNEFSKRLKRLVRFVAHVTDVDSLVTSCDAGERNYFFSCSRLSNFVLQSSGQTESAVTHCLVDETAHFFNLFGSSMTVCVVAHNLRSQSCVANKGQNVQR